MAKCQVLKFPLDATHHVDQDDAHDDHVELLVGDDAEDDVAGLPVRPRQRLQRLLGRRLPHGLRVEI